MSGYEPLMMSSDPVAAVPLNRRQSLRRLSLGLAWPALGGMLLSGCDQKGLNPMVAGAPKFNGVDITGAEYARALNLPDPTGSVRTLEEFRGKVVVVFFGFTQCPDICPTTMAEVAEVRRRLGPQGSKVQGVFVSVDPERDTDAVLTEYIKTMDPSFVALRGSVDQVTQAAREFKVFFQKVPSRDGKGYTMDHTAGAFVFDPQGHVRLFVRYGTPVDALTADVKQLLNDKG
jgi:protein SCO1/2